MGAYELLYEIHMRILLADDYTSLRELIEEFLEVMGHHVISAEDGAKALSLYQKEAGKFDLIITDIVMPEINGLELTKIIRKHNPLIPVIIISGFAPPQTIDEARSLNAIVYEKPINFELLNSHIELLQLSFGEQL